MSPATSDTSKQQNVGAQTFVDGDYVGSSPELRNLDYAGD